MKQTFGFALFGGYLALMASSLTMSMRVIYPYTVFTPLTSRADGTADLISSGVGVVGAGMFTVPVLVGVIVGGVVGSLTSLAGFVMRGPDGNRFVRVVAAGLVGAGIGVGLATSVAFGGLIRPTPDTGAD